MAHLYPGGGRVCSGSNTIPPMSFRKFPHSSIDAEGSDPSRDSSPQLSDIFFIRHGKISSPILFVLFFLLFHCLFVASVFGLIPQLFSVGSACAEERIDTRLPPALVTAETIQAKISEIEAASVWSEEEKGELLELCRKSLSNLQAIKSNLEATEKFRKETQAAPEQIESIKGNITELEREQQDYLAGVQAEMDEQSVELAQLLQRQQAELVAANTSRADVARRLEYMNARPVAISQRLAEAEQEQDEVEMGLTSSDRDGTEDFNEVRRWFYETAYMSLSTEITMLNEELLRKPVRTSLLEAKLKRQDAKIELIKLKIARITEVLNRQRLQEAEKVQREAEEVERLAKGGNPVLVKLSRENAELTKEINRMASQLESLDRDHDYAMKVHAQVTANFQDAQSTLKSSGLTEGLGKVLLAQQNSLPALADKEDEVLRRDEKIAEVEVMRLRFQAELRRLADIETFMTQLVDEVKVEKSLELFSELRPQVQLRKELLGKVMDMLELYLAGLRQLNSEERKLVASVTSYRQFLQQNLLWLRNAEPTRLSDVLELPGEIRGLYFTITRGSFTDALKSLLVDSPLFWLSVLIALYLLLKRKTLVAYIRLEAKIVGRPTSDNIQNTLLVCMATGLLEAPAPLLLAVAGWLLAGGSEHAVSVPLGYSLLTLSLYFFCLRFFRAACMPKGLGDAHFRWSKDKLMFLRKELDRFVVVIIPAGLLVLLSVNLFPENDGGILARLSFFIVYLALILFLYRILHPREGVLSHLRGRESATRIMSSYPILFFLLILFPIGLIILAFSGYLYSVEVVSDMFGRTLLLILTLILLKSLFLRWLEIVRRKISYEALLQKRKTLLEQQKQAKVELSEEESVLQFEEPKVDVAALTDETREFVTLAVFLAGLLGLYLIWSSFLPALKILDEVVLWHNTVKESGVDKQLPITLADLGLAVFYAVLITILAKRLPSLLEIILLRRTSMTSGDRYAVTTLSNYSIITVGAVLVLNSIGAQWSQLQWLVAALGVGIGFGLQEIIANFISGLIILFEQPVRVGDIVTIGDTDGMVTKIRIRATTIRNWDRKELLVPNKEFITGRLLNWSLADQVTRIFLMVGIAYGSDVDKAMELIRRAAEKQEHVLADPQPSVNFENFGDNSLNLSLRAYVDNIDYRLSVITEIHREINRLFAEAHIQIPFPQRDIHLDSGQSLRVKIEADGD